MSSLSTLISNNTKNWLITTPGGIISPANNLITSSLSLDKSYSGQILAIGLPTTATNIVLTLPLAQNSIGINFIISITSNASAAANISINTTSNETTITGYSIMNSTTAVQNGKRQINTQFADSSIGDRVELTCDGKSWLMKVFGSVAAAFTFS